MEKLIQIGKVNLKISQLPHLLLSVILLVIAPFFIGIENLDQSKTAKVLELFVALLGIILLPPIFLPEQNRDIRDLVESKYTSMITVYCLRLFMAIFFLGLLIGVYIVVLKHNNCVFPEIPFFLGTMAEAIFLGGLGLFAYSLFDQIAIAYLIPLMYYIMSIGGGNKLLKNLYPFSMGYGSYKEKYYLFALGAIFITLGISYPILSKRIIPKR